MNEFRTLHGSKSFADLEDWNQDPETAGVARQVRGNINKLVLYPCPGRGDDAARPRLEHLLQVHDDAHDRGRRDPSPLLPSSHSPRSAHESPSISLSWHPTTISPCHAPLQI
ncbi:uncharacterized protein PHACADRAFT_214891 [Phanerochaete carnosa HHB-10118-sp]|uniref:Uncharacterized protein n=1 Tax=Phanerochaete carnosa (strain HHB-10118-sp) TaxID=650164 RepID=K5UFL4_PHACS|nr:uncharacterized protein PHACADRAFT_214891 [Phanerochaete carnosa HHB-10118-sp]EKM48241.1 hypothetical protein PHACADRAFT_214891 [Phanerochaete carnosa HHB-10118-sp]